jgi:hypothetical protein
MRPVPSRQPVVTVLQFKLGNLFRSGAMLMQEIPQMFSGITLYSTHYYQLWTYHVVSINRNLLYTRVVFQDFNHVRQFKRVKEQPIVFQMKDVFRRNVTGSNHILNDPHAFDVTLFRLRFEYVSDEWKQFFHRFSILIRTVVVDTNDFFNVVNV